MIFGGEQPTRFVTRVSRDGVYWDLTYLFLRQMFHFLNRFRLDENEIHFFNLSWRQKSEIFRKVEKYAFWQIAAQGHCFPILTSNWENPLKTPNSSRKGPKTISICHNNFHNLHLMNIFLDSLSSYLFKDVKVILIS